MKHLFLSISLFVTSMAWAQTHTITIHEDNRVASLLMSQNEYSAWKNNYEFRDKAVREALFKDIYLKFNDDFDFIFLIVNEDETVEPIIPGELISVSNAVQGIGLNQYNFASNYGSKGKLKSVMHLGRRSNLRSGPSLHELMHTWANFGIPTESVIVPGPNVQSTAFIPHWGFTGANSPGQLGGFALEDLVDNGNNSYTVAAFGPNANGGNGVPYNQLELYLMGLIPAEEVATFSVFSDITSVIIDNTNNVFNFVSGTRTDYNPTALVERLGGARIPSSQNSQKNFKLLVVVLTDTPLTNEQWNEVNTHAANFELTEETNDNTYNFWEATGGRATIELGRLNESVRTTAPIIPVANFTASSVGGSFPFSVTFTDTSTGEPTAWSWDFGDGNTSTEHNPAHIYNTAGVYTVTLTATNADGEDIEEKVDYITVLDPSFVAPPQAKFSTSVTIGTLPLSVKFSDESTGEPTAWSWNFGDGNTSTEQNPTHIYTKDGIYTVSLKVTSEGGEDIEEKVEHIIVKLNIYVPIAQFVASSVTGVAPMTVQFKDLSTNYPTMWSWDFGDGNTSDEQNPEHIYQEAGVYSVTLTATNFGGNDKEEKIQYITVKATPAPIEKPPTTAINSDNYSYTTTIFPSPASDLVNIQLANDFSLHNLSLFNYMGQKINVETMMLSDNKIQLNVQDCPVGFYVLRLMGGNHEIIQSKMVIAR